ncbi:MAG: FkbM family methyltransferase [Verrucomicrobiota bacterium]|jgi:FkbM family methyltransferase
MSSTRTEAQSPESFSQFGEDALVWDYFQRKRAGFFVEVGANAPRVRSQTWLLEQQGWSGILVEPQAGCCKLLREQRPRSIVCQAACCAPQQRGTLPLYVSNNKDLSSLKKHVNDTQTQYVGTELVPALPLDEILGQTEHPAVDFISIDVEGLELDVLLGLDLQQHQPSLLLIEDHLHSLDLHFHLGRRGYKLVKRSGCNSWYVPRRHPFPVGLWDRAKLFRKVWLGTPLRAFRLQLKKWSLRRHSPSGA